MACKEGLVRVDGKLYSLTDAQVRVAEAMDIQAIMENTFILDLEDMRIIPLVDLPVWKLRKIIKGEGYFLALKYFKEV